MKFCCICGLEQKYISTEKVLKKYDVQYFQCTNCGLIQTEDPYWISEAYSDAIVAMDTGIIIRNISIAIRLTALLYVKFSNLKIGLDLAGGYGILTRLMRDFGYDFYWSDKFCENIVAKGFGINSIMTDKSIEVLTAFEVIEHLVDPLTFIKSSMEQYNCKTMIMSTVTYDDINLPPDNSWWYYSFKTGQHISFFHEKTISEIAHILKLNYYKISNFYILTDKKIKFNLFDKILIKYTSLIIVYLARNNMGSKTIKDRDILEAGKSVA